MWRYDSELLQDGRLQRFVPLREGTPISYREVLRFWRNDSSFCSFFIALLQQAPYTAYRWETPPVSRTTLDRQFEFVLLDTPGLSRSPDRQAFDRQFQSADKDRTVIGFPNLGNDAYLVVPCPAGPESTYVHLAQFVRHAPVDQTHDLWRLVGESLELRLSNESLWLSTAGMGIAWLHVRIDAQPKYYGYGPYSADSSDTRTLKRR